MSINKCKKLLAIFSTILVLDVALFTIATAKALNMVVEKKNIHPKMESCLQKLEKEYKKSAITARTLPIQNRKIPMETALVMHATMVTATVTQQTLIVMTAMRASTPEQLRSATMESITIVTVILIRQTQTALATISIVVAAPLVVAAAL